MSSKLFSKKISLFIFLILLSFLYAHLISSKVFSAQKDLPAITVINLIRGKDSGHEKDDLVSSLKDQWQVTREEKIGATWLFQYTALDDPKMVDVAKGMTGQEFGLLFEIDGNHAKNAGVTYRGQGTWYYSDGLFLISYDKDERRKLIDTAFAKFKKIFGYYPKTVGAWWIGGDSLSYMQKQYGITAALRAADQFSLDFYSIWGTPFDIPYLASPQNEGIPAESYDKSSKVVIIQWAARDPLNGYQDPLYSIQDYSMKGYDMKYVDYLAGIFLKRPNDNLVFGVENGGRLKNFANFYKPMIEEAGKLQTEKKVNVELVKDYSDKFLSSKKVFSGNNYFLTQGFDSNDQSFWYINENYRAGITKRGNEIYLIDLRNYADKAEEEFSDLPNSQKYLRVNEPSIIDSMHFPEQKKLISKSDEPIKIKREGDTVTLYTGDRKIADFGPSKLKLIPQNETFNFSARSSNIKIFQILIALYVIYFIVILLIKKDLIKSFKTYIPLLIPLLFAVPLLSQEPTFLFDKKELFLLYIFPSSFLSVKTIIYMIKVIPFIFLFAFHFLSLKSSKKVHKTIYPVILGLVTFLYLRIPYFPLDRSTYKIVFILFGLFTVFLIALSILIFIKTKSRKKLGNSVISILIILVLLGIVVFLSRSRYVLTPFEIQAYESIRTQNKDVIAIQQADFNIKPIYKKVKPLLYENINLVEKLTNKKWKIATRPESFVLRISDYDNKVIFVPRYLGPDLSPYEINTLKLRSVFDNVQTAIFEKK